ncbi:MAG: hypothetical protein K8T91_24125 [Planctomycetes bacterium]|nr:hypothetical protein [Planctomycetota bacterium]
MTLKAKITQQLSELDHSGALASGPQAIEIVYDGRQLDCEIEALDRLGCAVARMSVTSPVLASASLERLESIGQALAARLTYLLEPIAVLETDAEDQSVQMRSQPPQREGRQASYYELLAKQGRLELRRYVKQPGQPRTQVAAHLTREVLHRLIADLIEAAG